MTAESPPYQNLICTERKLESITGVSIQCPLFTDELPVEVS